MLEHAKPNDAYLDALIRSAYILQRTYTAPGLGVDGLVVWSKPFAEKGVVDLGAIGLSHTTGPACKPDLQRPDGRAESRNYRYISNGSFDSAGRTAPTATRMEGLLAALSFEPDRDL